MGPGATGYGAAQRSGEARTTRRLAQRRVRHFLADFRDLESRYPGAVSAADHARRRRVPVRRLRAPPARRRQPPGAGMIGHGRREIAERMAEQAATLEFVALDSGASHPKAVELAERLAELVPMDDPIFSFTSSGTESNDLAFKIARAYHARRGQPRAHAHPVAGWVLPRVELHGDGGDRRSGVPCRLRPDARRLRADAPAVARALHVLRPLRRLHAPLRGCARGGDRASRPRERRGGHRRAGGDPPSREDPPPPTIGRGSRRPVAATASS